MNRRLRKKLKVGEFRQLGFRVTIVCAGAATTDDFDALAREWLFEICDRLGLERCMAGWPPHYAELFAVRNQGSTSEEDRRSVSDWLRHRSGVMRFNVGPLVDVTHDPLENDDPLWDSGRGPFHYLAIPNAPRGTRLTCSRPFLAWLSRDYDLNGPISQRAPGVIRGVIRPA